MPDPEPDPVVHALSLILSLILILIRAYDDVIVSISPNAHRDIDQLQASDPAQNALLRTQRCRRLSLSASHF